MTSEDGDGSDETRRTTRSGKRKRVVVSSMIKWTEEMEHEVLEYARNSLLIGREFEKPTAPEYYKKFIEVTDSFKDIPLKKLVQHMKNVKRSYTVALEWRGKTGEGILHSDPVNGPESIEAELLKRCKHFKELDELLGDKPQFNPPYLHHTDGETYDVDENVFEVEEVNVVLGDINDPVIFDDSEASTSIQNEAKKDTRVNSTEAKTVTPKLRKSPLKSAAAALESAMKSRVNCEEKRLDWEMKCDEKNRSNDLRKMQDEKEIKERQLEFEREKWRDEVELRKSKEEKNFELEKMRIEKEAEIARYRIEKEWEMRNAK